MEGDTGYNDGTVLKFKKLTHNAIRPVKGSKYSAGFDLFSAEDKAIPPNSQAIIMTSSRRKIPNIPHSES